MNEKNILTKNEQPVRFTKSEVALSLLLSIFIYTAIWLLGTLMGFFIGIWAITIAVIVGIIIKKRKGPKVWILVISIFISIFIGNTSKLMMMTEEPIQDLFSIFLPMSIIIGGLVTGIIRYKDFLQSMKNKLIKYGFLIFVILGILLSAITGLVIHSIRLNLPSVEHLRATEVATGWVVKNEGLEFTNTKVEYKKAESTLIIEARGLLTSLKTKEECKNEADNLTKGLVLISKSVFDITTELTTEKIGEVNGHPCYIFYYDIIDKGNLSDKDAIVFYFWYCDKLQINFSAYSVIRNEPILKYISEVEEMVSSIKCH